VTLSARVIARSAAMARAVDALRVFAKSEVYSGAVSRNSTSFAASVQRGPTAGPGTVRVGETTITPTYVLDCRQ